MNNKTNNTTIDSYINPSGRFLDTVEQIDPDTMQHSRDILKDKKTDASLRNITFRTADFPLYMVENDDVVLYMADRENNLILKNLDKAVSDIRKYDNYFPKDSDIGAVINSESTLRVKLSDLNLKYHNAEWSYMEIDVNDPSKLNATERKLAEKVLGYKNDFQKTLDMFKVPEMTTIKFYVLNKDYVKKTLKNNNAKSISGESFLQRFDDGSGYIAGDGNLEYSRAVRGMPRKK